MKIIIKLILICILTIVFPAYAEKRLLVLGGGGESAEQVEFKRLYTFNMIADFSESSNWKKTDILIDANIPSFEKISKEKFHTKKSPFTAESYNEMIDNYIERMKQYNPNDPDAPFDEFKAGDQLMVIIDTHGARGVEGSKSHQVATSGDTNDALSQDVYTTVSLEKLETLAKLSKEKGVKLAIADLSCFSGTSQNLVNLSSLTSNSACIISSTGPQHYSFTNTSNARDFYPTFDQAFVKLLKSGKNLEDVFLEARNVANESSFPMISTMESSWISRQLYGPLTPYLYNENASSADDDLFKDFLKGLAANPIACQRVDPQFNELMNFINQIELIKIGSKPSIDLSELKKLISAYKEIQKVLVSDLSLIGDLPKLAKNDIFIAGSKFPISEYQLLLSDYSNNIEVYQRKIDDPSLKQYQNQNRELLKFYLEAKKLQDEKISAFPAHKEFANVLKRYDLNIKSLNSLTDRIAKEERKLYSTAYQYYSLKRQEKKLPNPCRDFVL